MCCNIHIQVIVHDIERKEKQIQNTHPGRQKSAAKRICSCLCTGDQRPK